MSVSCLDNENYKTNGLFCILPKTIHRFDMLPIKLPRTGFSHPDKPILKSTWKHNRPWIAKALINNGTNPEALQYQISTHIFGSFNQNSH